MEAPGGRTIARGATRVAPVLTALFAVVLDLLPLMPVAPQNISPALLLIVAYYWTLYRPDLLSSLDLFVLGLVSDVTAGLPIGVTSVTLLVIRRLVLTSRRPALASSFAMAWLGFTVTVLAALTARWLIMMILHGSLFPLTPVVIEALVTASIYPIVASILMLIGARLGKADDASAS